jgi:ABC-2 type transport system permease protein
MSLSYALRDSGTMLRRNLVHACRYPSLAVSAVLLPVVFLLLFVYVLGGTLGAGLGGASADRSAYLHYVTPGILVLALSSGAISTAVGVNTDLTQGITARFRTMAITPIAPLVGHVLGSVLQTVVSAMVVLGVAVLMGFRSSAGLLDWAGVLGLITLVAFAFTWIAVALGVQAKTPESASNAGLPLSFLPFLGTAFVPADSMPAGLRWFAENQPFTPMIETLRHLLAGERPGSEALVAVAWCLGLTALGYVWARRGFRIAAVR